VIILQGDERRPGGVAALNRDDMPLSSMAVPLIGGTGCWGCSTSSKFADPAFTTSDLPDRVRSR